MQNNSNMIETYKNQMFSSAASGDVSKIKEVLQLLDKRKGNTKSIIDERNEKGFTPLMLAARNNHLPMVQHLLENGLIY